MKRFAAAWLVVLVMTLLMGAPLSVVFAKTTLEYGVWQWTPLSQMSTAMMQQVVNEAATNHFTVIYQTVDEYLTIDAMPEGLAKRQQLNAYEASVNQFLTLAAAKGIAVDAEAGWRDWALPGNTWEPYEIMNFVTAYDQSHATKFRGIQYDIEPYLLPQYTVNEGAVLTQYAQLIEGLVGQDKRDGLSLGLDLPIFYTASAAATPEITIDGITNYPYNQILRLLNELPNSRVLLMAYRNFANGANGTIDVSDDEVHLADAGTTKVIIGQETGNVPPSYVTFYGTSKSALATQVGIVDQAFVSDTSFGGIAIDYLDPYMQLP